MLGETQKIAPFKAPSRGGQLAPGAWEFGRRVVPQWLDALEKRKDKKEKAALVAALVGDKYEYDPSKAAESFEGSPYLANQRAALADAQAQAQPEGVSALGLSPDDMALTPSFQSVDMEPENIEELMAQTKSPFPSISPGALSPSLQSVDLEPENIEELIAQSPPPGVEALFGSDPANKAAMQAALIGDVATPEQELAAYTGSPEERAAQERTFMATVHSPDEEAKRMAELVASNPDIANNPVYQQWLMSHLGRKQALIDEQRKHGRALEVATAGRAAPGITAKVAPNPNYNSGFGYVDLLTMTDLGEAPAPKPETQITIGSGDLKKGFRTTEEGAEAIPGGSEDPTVIAEKEKVTKMAGLGVKNLEKLPGKRGAIYADHIKTPTLRASINRAIELSKSAFSSGMAQWMLDKVPLPEVAGVNLGAAFDLQVALDSVKANVGFNELLRIKEAGGTLGALSEMENKLLQAMQGALVAEQDKEALIPALEQVMQIWELNLQQKKNEFKTIYSKDGGWETDERRPWEPPPGSGISQQEWDGFSAEEKAAMEAGA